MAAKPNRASILYLVAYILIVVGAVASAFLLVDYTHILPVFCDEAGSGCAKVRQSSYASFAGIPTPAIGLFGFAALLLSLTANGPLARKAFAACGSFGLLAALGFIGIQFRIGSFCKYCLVVDTCSILIGCIAIQRFREGWDSPEPSWRKTGRGAIAVFLVLLTYLFGSNKSEVVPEPVAREIASTPPNQLCVVEYMDFECPYCRAMHVKMSPLLSKYGPRVRLVRRHVPLSTIHPNAKGAAQAALCAEAQNKGTEYAEALFATPAEDMVEFGLLKVARQVGLDDKALLACMKSEATAARLAKDDSEYRKAKIQGLPSLYIGTEFFLGEREVAELEAAFERGLKGK